MLSLECLFKGCTPRLLVISWCYIVYIMLTQDESTLSVFIGGLRNLNVNDFTILGLLGGITPQVAVFSSPHGLTLSGVEHSLAAEKVLGDIG